GGDPAPGAGGLAVAAAIRCHAAGRVSAPPRQAGGGERLSRVHRGRTRLLDRPHRARARRGRPPASSKGSPMMNRRKAITSGGALLLGGAALLRKGRDAEAAPLPGPPGKGYTKVGMPNGSTLPFKEVDSVKEYHLVAEPVKREFAPGMVVNCWGYNG